MELERTALVVSCEELDDDDGTALVDVGVVTIVVAGGTLVVDELD